MFDDIVSDLLETIIGVIMDCSGTSPEMLKISDNTLSLIRPLWNELCLFGLGLSLIYFIIELNKIYAFEGRDMNMKSMLKPFLKLGFAVVALSCGARVINVFLEWHNSFIDTIDASLSGYMADPSFTTSSGAVIAPATIAEQMVDDMGFGTKIASLLFLPIAWCISAVLIFIWNFKAYGYQFEMLYRVGITPVALADIYSGQNANAIRWLKGFIGLALYGIAFVVIPRLGVLVSVDQFRASVDMLGGGDLGLFAMLSAIIGLLIVPIAELGVMGTIKQLCKEAMQ